MGGIQDNKSGLCLKKKESRRGMREKIMREGGARRGGFGEERGGDAVAASYMQIATRGSGFEV